MNCGPGITGPGAINHTPHASANPSVRSTTASRERITGG
jgi:hypothetical protein